MIQKSRAWEPFEMNIYRSRCLSFRSLSAVLPIIVVVLGGCASEHEVHYISVHQLRIEPERYVGDQVSLRGYLSRRWGPETGVPYLFATSDDARMANQAAAVFVDLYGNTRTTDLSACMQQFVEIEAEFGPALDPEAGSGLSLRDVRYLWVVQTGSHGSDESFQELEACVAPSAKAASP